jgi:hypothetical protein
MAAGALAGSLVAALVLGAGWAPDGEGDDEFRTDPRAVADLLASWERSRTETYRLEAQFRRSVDGRPGIVTSQEIVQRPPDRIVSQGGSIEARLDGRLVSCATGPDDELQCRDRGPAPPYDDEVADAVDALEGYVRDERRPPYFVDRVGGCFRLRLAVELPAASRAYGEAARLCFDPETGALLRTVVTRVTSEDVTEAVDVTAEVEDRDLRLPAAAGDGEGPTG